MVQVVLFNICFTMQNIICILYHTRQVVHVCIASDHSESAVSYWCRKPQGLTRLKSFKVIDRICLLLCLFHKTQQRVKTNFSTLPCGITNAESWFILSQSTIPQNRCTPWWEMLYYFHWLMIKCILTNVWLFCLVLCCTFNQTFNWKNFGTVWQRIPLKQQTSLDTNNRTLWQCNGSVLERDQSNCNNGKKSMTLSINNLSSMKRLNKDNWILIEEDQMSPLLQVVVVIFQETNSPTLFIFLWMSNGCVDLCLWLSLLLSPLSHSEPVLDH